MRGRVRVHRRAALDQKRRQGAITVKHAKTSSPPMAPCVDVRACVQQQLDHALVLSMNRGEEQRGAKSEFRNRIVEFRTKFRMVGQDLTRLRDVVGSNGVRQLLERHTGLRHPLNAILKLCPTAKAVLASDDELRIAQQEL